LSGADLCFLATSKSGLGHLRRMATIARRVQDVAPGRRVHLISNARPDGLGEADVRAFATVQVLERDHMAEGVSRTGAGVVVLDTITVPQVEDLGLPLALVLREAPDAALRRFRLAGDRPWDLVVVANPQAHWMPDTAALATCSVAPVGWIYRPTGPRQQAPAPLPQVLVATGGGGTAETTPALYAQIDALLARARQGSVRPFEVVQAIGPRAQGYGRLAQADRVVAPGAQLNELFREADIVISTAGYNSVLELATTDTPCLLVPIPRSIDDQEARARHWAGPLGAWHDAGAPGLSADWLLQEIATRRRRPPVDLGPSGEDGAAQAILGLG
jgi:predicted glycosyltransferase